MKFRIVEVDGKFYPQIKGWLFWNPLPCPDRSGMTSSSIEGVVWAFELSDAKKLINRYVWRVTEIHHEHK